MNSMMDTGYRLAEVLGLREPSTWERVQRIDWRDYAPSRPSYNFSSQSSASYDVSSLLIGLAVGVGVGIGLGYAMKGNVAPAARRVRERTQGAVEGIQSRLPERLRVTRMEEQPATR